VGLTSVGVTVGDALVVVMRAAARCGADSVGAVVLAAALTETFDAVRPLAGDSVADGETLGTELMSDDCGSVVRAVDSDVVFFVEEFVVAVLTVEVLLVPVVVTDVFAPPEACTIPVSGAVDDPDSVEESADAAVVADVEDCVLVVSVLVDDADVESLDDEVFEVSVDSPPVVSASAIAGLLAIATPIPSVTAKAPTRPIYLA
jgi:hypothetical protein